MAEQDGDNFGDTRVPGELFRQTAPRVTSPAAVDLAEALGGLDRATKNFTRRLGEGQREVEQARLAGEQAIRDVGQSSADARAGRRGHGRARGDGISPGGACPGLLREQDA